MSIVVVADDLPARLPEHLDLFSDRPPGVEVFPYTVEEFDGELARRNAIALEASDVGVDLIGGAEPE